MGRICNFAEFSNLNEGLSTKDAKQTIKDIFDKFDGTVDDKYLKDMWKAGSTLRNLYGKELFDKAWDELIDAGTIETEDGKEWCWCAGKKKKELVNEERELTVAQIDELEDSDIEELPSKRNEFSKRYHHKASGRQFEVSPSGKIHEGDDEAWQDNRTDITDELTDKDAEGAKEIDGPNEFTKRYQLKDGRKVDVTPAGRYLLVNESVNEKLDGEELLSAKQKKLPEALKKGIIAKLKKQKPKKDEDEEEEKEDKKGKKGEKEEDKDDKKKSGSDEEKYLTPKQRKLPEGLKKGIIARAKKNAK